MKPPRKTASPKLPRKASRDVRRQQLIDATIRVLGEKGYAALTVADVARAAGLSPGIVIFHFTSKDELLAEVLRFLAADYRAHWEARMNEAGPEPADRLKALMLADFDARVFTAEKLAAWIAFWGETQGRPTYDQICSGPDAERVAATLALCKALVKEESYDIDPILTARALEALCDGLWFGVAANGAGHKGRVSAKEAQRVVRAALAAFFPRHFG